MTAPSRPPAVPRVPCAAECGETIRRSTGLRFCKSCGSAAWQAFQVATQHVDPTTYQRMWFDWYADKALPAISAAKAARMAGAVT